MHPAALASDQARLLKQVSRSFYLTLRVLPGRIRPQISVAYLLARATDTIADTGLVPVTLRLQALDRLRQFILGTLDGALELETLLGRGPSGASVTEHHGGTLAEQHLLQHIGQIVAGLSRFSDVDQTSIRQVLSVITTGQILDLQRFGSAQPEDVAALETAANLEDYTYRVAGCVGEFWTQLCRRHVFPEATLDDQALLQKGIRFGQGLQLVNILRDLPSDLRQGRCYLPVDELREVDLVPQDLLDPNQETRLRSVYDRWLDRAQRYLQDGWSYTCQIPRRYRRLRLACAWPLLIGTKTLSRLRTGPCLDPSRKAKVPRQEVRSILLRSVLLLPFSEVWEAQFHPRPPAP